jgi:hypothetical protein
MTAPQQARIFVTIHLTQQATVVFDAADLWPRPAGYTRTDNDLPSFAEQLSRRLHSDGFIGYSAKPDSITVIPIGSVKRIDFSMTQDGPAH